MTCVVHAAAFWSAAALANEPAGTFLAAADNRASVLVSVAGAVASFNHVRPVL